jgi:adenylate cyclase
VEAQTALAKVNAGVPPDKHINFRIGIHIGDVMVRAGNLFGDGVNIAARLQTLAPPEPCVSPAYVRSRTQGLGDDLRSSERRCAA